MRTPYPSPSESQHNDVVDPVRHSMLAPFEFSPKISMIGLWDYHFDNGSVTANTQLSGIYGYGAQDPEWSVELFLRHIIPEDRERVHQSLSEILTCGSDFLAEYRIATVDGEIRTLRSMGGVLYKDGKPAILRGTTFDITKHKSKLQDLAVQRDQWEFVIKELGLGLWTWNVETGETTRNDTHAEIFGYDIREKPTWSLKVFLDHIVPEDRARVQSIITESQNLRREHRFDCRIQRTDGAVRWVSVAGKMIQQAGEQKITYGVTQDITATKERELENAELEASLLQSQKMEVLGKLAGGIAHDFNNVLTAIQGNTELVLTGIDPASPHHKKLTSVINSVNRSAAMVKQLLSFARKNPGKPVDIDIDAEINQTYLMLRKLIRENIRLDLKLNSRQASVNLDPSHLVQILTNLVVNAHDAIAECGTISIETGIINNDEAGCSVCPNLCIRKPHIRIAVRDTGAGIDTQTMPHIFEPFFTTKEIGKGTGLGLSTIYGLVKQNNGKIFCHSEVGKGTTVEIHFPGTLQAKTAEAGTFVELPKSTGCKSLILIVEDEHEISSIINRVLEKQGFVVRSTDNAESALALMERTRERFDLVISDIMLPGMNGVQMIKVMLKKHPDMKFLFMSGYSADAIGHYGVFDAGSSFISKPFTISNLIKKVVDVLMTQA
jgi:PAS domain S-box-containing protein